MLSQNALEHLEDIDFRSREERQALASEELVKWYNRVFDAYSADPSSEWLGGQLSMISACLWMLLPKAEYKKLRTIKYKKVKDAKNTTLL